MQQYFRPQINSFTDKANYVLCGSACTALCAGVGYITDAARLVIGASFVAAVAVNYFHTTGLNYILERNFPPTPEKKLPPGAEDLSIMLAQIAEKLDVPPPTLHVILEKKNRWLWQDDDDIKSFTKDDIRSDQELKVAALFRRNANAMIYGTNKTGVIVLGELVKRLSSEDKAFMMAHELGHQAARHLVKERPIALILTTSSYTAFANFLLTTFGNWTGWMAPALGWGAAVGSNRVLIKMLPETMWDKHEHALKFSSQALGIGTLFGVSCFTYNSQVAVAWTLSMATTLAVKVLHAGYGRAKEFQADRIGAEVIGNPQQAAVSLKNIYVRIQEAMKASETNGYNNTKNRIYCAFKKAKELLDTDPPINKRISRLEKMVLKSSPAP